MRLPRHTPLAIIMLAALAIRDGDTPLPKPGTANLPMTAAMTPLKTGSYGPSGEVQGADSSFLGNLIPGSLYNKLGTYRRKSVDTLKVILPAKYSTFGSSPPFPSDVRIMPSGKSLYIRMQDSEREPANISAIAAHPSIAIDGGPPIRLDNPVWGLNPINGLHQLPYAFYSLPSVVPDGAAVTVSAAAGWCTAGGQPAQAMNAVAAVRGVLLPEVADTPKTMELGVNVVAAAEYAPAVIFANLMRSSSPYYGAPLDEFGYPTGMGGQSYLRCDVAFNQNTGIDDKGWPNLPHFGTYTMLWKGGSDRELLTRDHTTAVTQIGAETSEGGWRVKRYNVTFDRAQTHSAQLEIRSYGFDFTAECLYDPSIPDPVAYADDAQGRYEFHPLHLAQLGKPANLRFMDAHSTNNSSRFKVEHFTPRQQRSYSGTSVRVFGHVPIVKVEDYAETEGYFRSLKDGEGRKWPRFKVTTATPHGYKTGQIITLNCPGSIGGVEHLSTDTGGPGVPIHAGSDRPVFVLSPTEFVQDYSANVNHGSLTKVYTAASGELGPNPTCYMATPCDYPLQSSVNLCNILDADAYICIPHLMEPAEVARLVRIFAHPTTGLKPGLKLIVEHSNEVWNNGPSFLQTKYFELMGHYLGGYGDDLRQYYAKVASDTHAAAMAEWTARGRAPSDLIRVIGTQGGYPAWPTASTLNWLAAHNKQIDVLAVGVYMSNRPEYWGGEPYIGLDPAIVDAMDREQVMDMWEVHFLHGEQERFVTVHGPYLDEYADKTGFPRPRMVCYEGGPEKCLPAWTNPTNQAEATLLGRRLRETVWHPRFRHCWRWHLQNMQDHGTWFMADYLHAHGGVRESYGGFPVTCQMWGIYRGLMQPGRGDGSDGLNDNRVALEDYGRIVSPRGLANLQWQILSGRSRTEPRAK